MELYSMSEDKQLEGKKYLVNIFLSGVDQSIKLCIGDDVLKEINDFIDDEDANKIILQGSDADILVMKKYIALILIEKNEGE